MKNLTLKEAAEKMHCCAAYARKRLIKLDRENPGMGLVARPTGNPLGRIEVNPIALALITSRTTALALDELSERVGMVEADIGTIRARLGGIERRMLRQENRQTVACAG